jgi:hypothetical protein
MTRRGPCGTAAVALDARATGLPKPPVATDAGYGDGGATELRLALEERWPSDVDEPTDYWLSNMDY